MSISLSKNQSVSLAKEAPSLTHLLIGLGWDAVQKKGFFGKLAGSTEIDLDASVIMADASKNIVDCVWFRQLKSKDGSLVHSGDNRTGEGEGDDESIRVDLAKVPGNVSHLIVTVNSYQGQTFNEVENSFCRIVDQKTNKEIAKFELKEKGANSGFVMAVVSREGNGWTVKALGVPASGRTVQDLLTPALGLI